MVSQIRCLAYHTKTFPHLIQSTYIHTSYYISSLALKSGNAVKDSSNIYCYISLNGINLLFDLTSSKTTEHTRDVSFLSVQPQEFPPINKGTLPPAIPISKMRASHREPRSLLLLLTLLLAPTALAFSLAEIQQISGFGPACTKAYSLPFTTCTYDDFYGPKGCSTACASSLGALLANIGEACNGQAAIPSTMIGLILSGAAFNTLCPGATGSAGGSGSPAGGAGGGGSNNGNADGKSSVHLPLPTDVASPTATTLAASNVSPTSTSSFGLHSYLTPMLATSSTTTLNEPLASFTLNPASTTITSLSAVSSTALQISTSTLKSTVPLSDLTRVSSTPTTTKVAAATSSSTTSSSSTSRQTSQGSNPQGAGGGTPFDITSASCRNWRSAWWTMPVPTAIFVLLWLV